MKLLYILYWWIHTIINVSEPTECTKPRVKANMNYRLCVKIMCQRRFFNCNKGSTPVGDTENTVGEACVRAGSIWEVSISSAQFSCGSKTALKAVYLKRSISDPVVFEVKFIIYEIVWNLFLDMHIYVFLDMHTYTIVRHFYGSSILFSRSIHNLYHI